MARILALLTCAAIALATAASKLPDAPTDPVGAVQTVVDILVPQLNPYLTLVVQPSANETSPDWFRVESGPGENITVSGPTGVAIASGINAYLASQGLVLDLCISTAMQLSVPPKQPPQPIEATSPVRWRYAWNVCTFGYTSAGWKWPSWQRAIAVMAMQGVNMPLAFVGFEHVLSNVFAGLQITGLEDTYFTGLPFLPWQRMGNLAEFGGPLTASIREARHTLQRSILSMQTALGMHPVLPCFAGNVPKQWVDLHNGSLVQQYPSWNGIVLESYLLDPTDPLFAELGTAIAKEQVRLYGDILSPRFFSCDVWMNDRHSLAPLSTNASYLGKAGAAIPNNLKQATSDAVWVTQGGWYFAYPWWKADGGSRREAYVAQLTQSDVLILDLDMERGNEPTSYTGNLEWVWCLLHAFGGRPGMHGNLDFVGAQPFNYLPPAGNSSMVGMGVTSEGMLTDPVVYALFYDAWWSQTPLNTTSGWLESFVARRYGGNHTVAGLAAWKLLSQPGGVYGPDQNTVVQGGESTKRPRTSVAAKANSVGPTAVAEAWRELIGAAVDDLNTQSNTTNTGLVYDVVDVGRETLDMLVTDALNMLLAAVDRQAPPSVTGMSSFLIGLVKDLGSLLEGSPCRDHFLGNWIEDARSWAPSDGIPTADDLERDARNQLTIWGPSPSIGPMDDYAAKAWSDLYSNYYVGRFEVLTDAAKTAAEQKTKIDTAAYDTAAVAYEQGWANSTGGHMLNGPIPPTQALQRAVNVYEQYLNSSLLGFKRLVDVDCGGLDCDLLPVEVWTRDTAAMASLCLADPACKAFNTNGWLKSSATINRHLPPGTADLYVRL